MVKLLPQGVSLREAGHEKKFVWKRNGLRHSFCGFRLALIQDVAKAALEAGNFAMMIFKHYRELTTEDEAKEWFAVCPPKAADNIVLLSAAPNG